MAESTRAIAECTIQPLAASEAASSGNFDRLRQEVSEQRDRISTVLEESKLNAEDIFLERDSLQARLHVTASQLFDACTSLRVERE